MQSEDQEWEKIITKKKNKKQVIQPLSEVIIIEEDEEPNFVPEKILEKKGNKYLIRWKGMDEASARCMVVEKHDSAG